jgi:hypothetical protein
MSEIQILQTQRDILEELIKIRQLLERQQMYPVVLPATPQQRSNDCSCPPLTNCMNVACPRSRLFALQML